MISFASLVACVAALSLATTLVLGLTPFVVLGRRPPTPTSDASPRPVSVLKPLKGTDPDLYDNLAALARQDHPDFELVLGTAAPDDPALEVARRLARDFPAVAITVVSGAPDRGLNPKVSNLAHIARSARHDLLLVSDADVRPGPGYLRSMVAEMERPGVGMVSSLLTGIEEESLGAAFENLHLSTFAAPGVAAADVLARHPLVIGKSMMFSARTLEAVGGWSVVENVLAEDYLLGRLFRRRGHAVALCARPPLPVVNRRRSLGAFLGRHLRWAQMRRRIQPWAYLVEPLANPAPWILATTLLALLGAPAFGVSTPAVLAAAVGALALVLLLDAALVRRLRGTPMAWRWLALAPLKDSLILALWPVGAVKRTIDWRGTELRIGPDSVLEPIGVLEPDNALEPDGSLEPVGMPAVDSVPVDGRNGPEGHRLEDDDPDGARSRERRDGASILRGMLP